MSFYLKRSIYSAAQIGGSGGGGSVRLEGSPIAYYSFTPNTLVLSSAQQNITPSSTGVVEHDSSGQITPSSSVSGLFGLKAGLWACDVNMPTSTTSGSSQRRAINIQIVGRNEDGTPRSPVVEYGRFQRIYIRGQDLDLGINGTIIFYLENDEHVILQASVVQDQKPASNPTSITGGTIRWARIDGVKGEDGEHGTAVTDADILNLAKATRNAGDRDRLLATSDTSENNLVLTDRPTSYDDTALKARVAKAETTLTNTNLNAIESGDVNRVLTATAAGMADWRAVTGGTSYDDTTLRNLIQRKVRVVTTFPQTADAVTALNLSVGEVIVYVGEQITGIPQSAGIHRFGDTENPSVNEVSPNDVFAFIPISRLGNRLTWIGQLQRQQTRIESVSHLPDVGPKQDADCLFILSANSTNVKFNNESGALISDGKAGDIFLLRPESLRWQRVGNILRHDNLESSIAAKSKITTGVSFPSSPATGDLHIFTSGVASGLTWQNETGTALTSASVGDVAYWTGSAWRRAGNLSLSDSRHLASQIASLVELTTGISRVTAQAWQNNPSDADVAVIDYTDADAIRIYNGQQPNAATDWQKSLTILYKAHIFLARVLITSGPDVSDFGILTQATGDELPSRITLNHWQPYAADATYRYYVVFAGSRAQSVTTDGTVAIQHKGTSPHVQWGDLIAPQSAIVGVGGAIESTLSLTGIEGSQRLRVTSRFPWTSLSHKDASATTWSTLAGGGENNDLTIAIRDQFTWLCIEYIGKWSADNAALTWRYYDRILLSQLPSFSVQSVRTYGALRNAVNIVVRGTDHTNSRMEVYVGPPPTATQISAETGILSRTALFAGGAGGQGRIMGGAVGWGKTTVRPDTINFFLTP